MNIEEFLSKDQSFLSNPLTRMFFGENVAKTRKAYEDGVRIGYNLGVKEMENSYQNPHNVNLTTQEYQDFMALLTAFGYQFIHLTIPSYRKNNEDEASYNSGLNICKNQDAIDAGVTISEEIKQQVFNLLKKNTKKELWRHKGEP